jgi:hypothetical protein
MADSLTNSPAHDRSWSRACRERHPVRPGVSEPSRVRILLRPPVMPYPPRDKSATSMVSDSGSETGAASSAHMRLAAVRCGQLDRAQRSDQHIHSSSGTLFECLPGSGRRGRRFKSGHPDRKTAGHEANRDLPFALHLPGCPIWEPVGSGQRTAQGTHWFPGSPALVCPLRCRIQPYLIKAAPLRSGVSAGSGLGGPADARRAGTRSKPT